MDVSLATLAGDPATGNEDFVAVGGHVAMVLDGVTPVDRDDTGCRHGVAWFARALGARLFAAAESERPLADCLAEAIDAVRKAHEPTCDLGHWDSPAATVAVMRWSEDTGEYLVLADSPIVLDETVRRPDDTAPRSDDGVRVIVDDRPSEAGRRAAASGTRPPAREFRTAFRNRPDGYWVAAEDPAAAYEALTGRFDLRTVRRALVASDGGTRLVDVFGHSTWRQALDVLTDDGPAEWLRRTRSHEADLAAAGRGPGKPHDDATVVLLRWGDERPAEWRDH